MDYSTKSPQIAPVILPKEEIATRKLETFGEGVQSRGELGWHTLFSSTISPTNSLTAGVGVCPPRTGHLCPHRHEQAEVYYITEGDGIVTIDGKESRVGSGTAVFIPGNAEHGIRNISAEDDLKWFYVFATDSFEDVIYRFS
jgi:mannose-6-phosphate isomerase-like protein (cupin superfamily)